MKADALVRDYLGRLEAAAWPLPAERRGELLVEVREHIESALSDAGRSDEVTARNVLDRLGAPEEIVAAEADAGGTTAWQPPAAAVTQGQARWGPVEVSAILFLTVGAFFLPVLGPMIGLILAWLSSAWTTRQKTIATLIGVALLALPIVLLLGTGAGSTSSGLGG